MSVTLHTKLQSVIRRLYIGLSVLLGILLVAGSINSRGTIFMEDVTLFFVVFFVIGAFIEIVLWAIKPFF